MTNEEADVMRELSEYAESSGASELIAQAKRLLTQHADDQIEMDLEWLDANIEGDGHADEHDWWFQSKNNPQCELNLYAEFTPSAGIRVSLFDSHGTDLQIGTTRSDMRALERLGLLVAKKKGEGE